MKSDFVLAITQLAAEKNLPQDVVIKAVENALVSAYRKDSFTANQNIAVRINPGSGTVQVWAEKVVVDEPQDLRQEMSLAKAREIKPDIEIGDTIEVEDTPHNAGRIAAQTAKQVILQRLHEAEHTAIYEEYADKTGEVLTGVVRRFDHRQIYVDLGRTEAVLPPVEQMHNDRYRVGQRIKVYVLDIAQTPRGPQVIVSRTHRGLLQRLFDLEVPEIGSGVVEIVAVAREAGFRSKIAVAARQEGIDPVGCCVGLRGIRIQSIVNELNGEKIDVVMWSADTRSFITSALSPARVMDVRINGDAVTAVIPDQQLSLAIGREGQNVRLAAKLTGWRIDIKSASEAEKEIKEMPVPAIEPEAVATPPAEDDGLSSAGIPDIVEPVEETETEAPPEAVEDEGEEFGEPVEPEEVVAPELVKEPEEAMEKPAIRFAEDVMRPEPVKTGARSKKKKKKKGASGKENAEDGIKIKRMRRVTDEIDIDETEDYG